jgi:hypothetical protein
MGVHFYLMAILSPSSYRYRNGIQVVRRWVKRKIVKRTRIQGWVQWLTLSIPATLEAEVRGLWFEARQDKVRENPHFNK